MSCCWLRADHGVGPPEAPSEHERSHVFRVWDEGQASVGLKEDGRRAKENSPLFEDIASIGEQRNGVAMKGDTGLRLALFFKMTEVASGYRRLVEKEDRRHWTGDTGSSQVCTGPWGRWLDRGTQTASEIAFPKEIHYFPA